MDQQGAKTHRAVAIICISDPSSSRHPRFRIKTLQLEGHDISTMGDFNATSGSDPSGIVRITSPCSFVDVLYRRIGSCHFATISGGRSHLDYGLMSPNATAAVRHCGYDFDSKATILGFGYQ
jgi:hypothetical protein